MENLASMDIGSIHIKALRRRLRPALDIVVAHRIAKGLVLNLAQVTKARDRLEQGVLLALEETEDLKMPEGWSWQLAAENISAEVAFVLVHEQELESNSRESNGGRAAQL